MGFLEDTAVAPDGSCVITDRWDAPLGPNGGYIAAMVVRAMTAAVDDAERAPRSLTCHYLRPPKPGPARIEATVERRGGSLSTVMARLVQDGEPKVLAVGAFSRPFQSPVTWEMDAPSDVPPPGDVEPFPPHEQMPNIAQRLETRWAVGALPFTGGDEARSGGWLALRDDAVELDAAYAAFLTDAWMPASFSRLTQPAAAPTIDLTVHFRAPLPLEGTQPGDPMLVLVTSRHAQHGFVEEDAEVWTQDGRLVAMARQLAILR